MKTETKRQTGKTADAAQSMNPSGKLIVIEGLDGSGKATQAKRLEEALSARMHTRKVSFPDYESDSSALVRMYLRGDFGSHPDDVNAYAASSFYAVDRYASFKRDWQKDYEKGAVVADRYTTSNAVHQCSKLPPEKWDGYLDWLFDFEYDKLGIPKPDLVIYLRVDTDLSQELMNKRYHGEDKRDIHEKDLDYLARCRSAAEYCSEKFGWRIVECVKEGKMRSVEDIGNEVLSIVDDLFA